MAGQTPNNLPQFTPDLVYNLIAGSPQGRAFVENLAKMNQLQQAAQQFAPQIQQFAQNPMQAMNSIGQWAQGAVDQMQQQIPAQPQQVNQEQALIQQSNQAPNGGAPMNNSGMIGMALEIVGKFENSLKEMSDTLKTITETNKELTEKVSALTEDNKILVNDLSATRTDLGKLLESLG